MTANGQRKPFQILDLPNQKLKYLFLLGAVCKLGFWFKVKAAVRFQPQEYFIIGTGKS
jgi:hypothetical protein